MESFELLCSLPGCYFSTAEDNQGAGPEAPVTLDVRPPEQQKKAKQAIRLPLTERAREEVPHYGAGADLGQHLEHTSMQRSRG